MTHGKRALGRGERMPRVILQSRLETAIPQRAAEAEGDRRRRILVLALFLIGLLIRVAYVWTLGDKVHWPDETEYHGIAVNLLAGKGYAYFRDYGSSVLGPTAYRMPALPALLALLYALTGPHLLAARLLQALMGALLIPTAYSIARELHYSPIPGILAGCLLAIYPYYVFCAGTVYPVVLPALLVAAATLLLLRGARRGDIRLEAAAGLALGAGILAMGHLIGAIPFLIAWILLNKKASPRRRWLASAAMCSVILIVVLPWVVRNRIVMGRTCLSTAFAYNLYVGNRPEARWNSGSRVMDMEPPDVRHTVAKMREGDACPLYSKLAALEIRARPGRFVMLSLGRAANFWRLYPNAVLRPLGMKEKLVGGITYGPILLVSAVWMMIERKRRRLDFLLVSCPIGAMLISAITVSVDRYRLPFDMYLIILTSVAVVTWAYRTRLRGSEGPMAGTGR